jgi:hypothetical protein
MENENSGWWWWNFSLEFVFELLDVGHGRGLPAGPAHSRANWNDSSRWCRIDNK